MKTSIRIASFVGLALVVVFSARPYAAGWNDGSRLAAAESLVDRGTFSIDDSIFVRVPPPSAFPKGGPYAEGNGAWEKGIGDKVFVRGHYYSDKPPTHAVALALVYGLVKGVTGLSMAERPDVHCRILAVVFAGVPFLVAVLALDKLFRRAAPRHATLLLVSFVASTGALVYTQYVNAHILALGLVSVLVSRLHTLEDGPASAPFVLGLLAGATYAVDLGLGPVLVLATAALIVVRGGTDARSRARALALFLAGVAPFAGLHHALNYSIGGTLRPISMVREYFLWPGSTFTEANLTGLAAGRGFWKTVRYTGKLLVGPRGYLVLNPPLLLVIPGLLTLWKRRRDRPEITWALGVFVGTWLLYGWKSSDYSGGALAIRWFVPLLAPAFLLLALALEEREDAVPDFVLLSIWGAALMLLALEGGPFRHGLVPLQWAVTAAALYAWAVLRFPWGRATFISAGGSSGRS